MLSFIGTGNPCQWNEWRHDEHENTYLEFDFNYFCFTTSFRTRLNVTSRRTGFKSSIQKKRQNKATLSHHACNVFRRYSIWDIEYSCHEHLRLWLIIRIIGLVRIYLDCHEATEATSRDIFKGIQCSMPVSCCMAIPILIIVSILLFCPITSVYCWKSAVPGTVLHTGLGYSCRLDMPSFCRLNLSRKTE